MAIPAAGSDLFSGTSRLSFSSKPGGGLLFSKNSKFEYILIVRQAYRILFDFGREKWYSSLLPFFSSCFLTISLGEVLVLASISLRKFGSMYIEFFDLFEGTLEFLGVRSWKKQKLLNLYRSCFYRYGFTFEWMAWLEVYVRHELVAWRMQGGATACCEPSFRSRNSAMDSRCLMLEFWQDYSSNYSLSRTIFAKSSEFTISADLR